MRFTWRAAALAIALAGSPAAALAQSNDIVAIVERLDRLERDLGDWQRFIARDGEAGTVIVPDTQGMSEVNRRIADLNQDLRDLASQSRVLDINLEEFADRLGQFAGRVEAFGTRLDDLVKAVDTRLTALEEAEARRALEDRARAREPVARDEPAAPDAAGAPAAGEAALDDVAATRGLPDGTPMERYDFARAALRRGDYAEAERAFRAFVEAHPADELAGNAQYWLAETHYVRNDYDAAAREFLDGYQRYPLSPKAPDFLLKLGMTLSALGQRAEACATLEELAAKFPLVTDDMRRRSAEERAGLGCP